MNREEIDIFRQQRIASPEGQAVIESLAQSLCPHCHGYATGKYRCPCGKTGPHDNPMNTSDGTAGHSKGDWELSKAARWSINNEDHHIAMVNYGTIGNLPLEGEPNAHLILLAQQAPHDCGDPECQGVKNKRKLELEAARWPLILMMEGQG